MANELQVPYYISGATLYVIISNAAAQIWDGTAFVPYVSANYATYARSLVEQGAAEMWLGNWPTAIPNGSYSYVAYVRYGATAAETDKPCASLNYFWGGYVPVSTIITGPTASLAKAIENHLREWLSDAWTGGLPTADFGKIVGNQLEGQPPPAAGQTYYGIEAESCSSNANQTNYIDMGFAAAVTITLKAGIAPSDRQARELMLKGASGLYDRADALAMYLHGSYALMTKANTLFGGPGDTSQGFCEPLKFRSRSKVMAKGPDWFWCVNDQKPSAGLAITVSWQGMRYIKGQVQ